MIQLRVRILLVEFVEMRSGLRSCINSFLSEDMLAVSYSLLLKFKFNITFLSTMLFLKIFFKYTFYIYYIFIEVYRR